LRSNCLPGITFIAQPSAWYSNLFRTINNVNKENTLPKRKYNYYANLLKFPESIAVDLRTYTKDPTPIEAHRARVARAIERLSRK